MEEQQKSILDCDYSKVNLKELVCELNIYFASKKKLYWMLKKFPTLFGGVLGKVDCELIHMKLKQGAKPSNQRYYNNPKAYESVTKCEVKLMCEIGMLEKMDHHTNSPLSASTFIQTMKTGDVQVLMDLRKVNKLIEYEPFPLWRINDLIQKMQKFISATALNLSQGYYNIPVDKESSQICTTILPWGTMPTYIYPWVYVWLQIFFKT